MTKSTGYGGTPVAGRIIYSLLFGVVLPAYLIFWADNLAHIRLPDVPNTPEIGALVSSIGFIILISGVWSAVVRREGSTINAELPKQYVRTGIYKWISHPIYLGSFSVCAGISIWSGSAGGLWVITPFVALVCTALIWGYERPHIIGKYGDIYFDHKIRLPLAINAKPEIMDFISIVLLVYLPWLLVYQGIASYIGVVDPVWVSTLPFEENFPVFESFAIPYVLTYPIAVFAPLFAKTQNCQRKYCIAVILALTIVIPFYLTFPIIAEFRPLEPTTIWGDIIILQHSVDNPATAFPAFHVVWGILCAKMFSDHYPKFKALFWFCAWLIAFSCWFTGMHAILDVFAGTAVSFFVLNYEKIWLWIKNGIEAIGNSWRSRTIGHFRIINHFKFTACAALLGLIFTVSILGSEHLVGIMLIIAMGIMGAAILAKIVNGPNNEFRSFGYFGGLIGVSVGAWIVDSWLGLPWMISISTVCIVAPFVLAIGRLRCLVQGCCHGASASDAFGIIITQPNTRLCSRTDLCGKPIHPTQFYSIVSNIFIGMVMFRMLMVGSQSANVISVYLILSSLARFVEETYRGEPHTPAIGGLSLYQWLSIAGLLLGSVFTMIPSVNVTFSGFTFSSVVWGGSSDIRHCFRIFNERRLTRIQKIYQTDVI